MVASPLGRWSCQGGIRKLNKLLPSQVAFGPGVYHGNRRRTQTQTLSLNLELSDLAALAGQRAPGRLPPQHWITVTCRWAWLFSRVLGGPDSGPAFSSCIIHLLVLGTSLLYGQASSYPGLLSLSRLHHSLLFTLRSAVPGTLPPSFCFGRLPFPHGSSPRSVITNFGRIPGLIEHLSPPPE